MDAGAGVCGVYDKANTEPTSAMSPWRHALFLLSLNGISAPLEGSAIDAANSPVIFVHTHQKIEFVSLQKGQPADIAHLAGAMGKPVWLLNRFDTCWRWFVHSLPARARHEVICESAGAG
jgi:hypothetical protein